MKEQTVCFTLKNNPKPLSKTVAWSNFLPKSMKIDILDQKQQPQTEALNQHRENHKLQI